MVMFQVGTDGLIAFLQTINWASLYIATIEVLVAYILAHSCCHQYPAVSYHTTTIGLSQPIHKLPSQSVFSLGSELSTMMVLVIVIDAKHCHIARYMIHQCTGHYQCCLIPRLVCDQCGITVTLRPDLSVSRKTSPLHGHITRLFKGYGHYRLSSRSAFDDCVASVG